MCEEYKKYVAEKNRVPVSETDEHIIDEVLDKMNGLHRNIRYAFW